MANCRQVQHQERVYWPDDWVKTRKLGLVHHIPAKAFQGYTLFALVRGRQASLIDMNGQFVQGTLIATSSMTSPMLACPPAKGVILEVAVGTTENSDKEAVEEAKQ